MLSRLVAGQQAKFGDLPEKQQNICRKLTGLAEMTNHPHRKKLAIMRISCSPLLPILAACAPLAALTQPTALGPEFQCNSYWTDNQLDAAVAADEAGNFVVAWDSWKQDGSINGVFAQRFDPAGYPLGEEFIVNTYTQEEQETPDVAMDQEGGFVVVWAGFGQGGEGGIFARRYNNAGAAAGMPFKVSSFNFGIQNNPSVAMDKAGNFIAVWSSAYQDGDGRGIFAQRYNSAGTKLGEEFQVNANPTHHQLYPVAAMDSEGNFAVAWLTQGPLNTDIYARRFSKNGSPLSGDLKISEGIGNSPLHPAIAMDEQGAWVVAWDSPRSGGSPGTDVSARRYLGNNPAQAAFKVNSSEAGYHHSPCVKAAPDGSIVVLWTSDQQDGDDAGVSGRRFNSNGLPLEEDFQVNTFATANQRYPALAMTGEGSFVAVWESQQQDGDGYGIYGKRFGTEVTRDATATAPGEILQVFPNPTSEVVFINAGRGQGFIVNQQGQLMAAWEQEEEKLQPIGVENWPPGVYFVGFSSLLGPSQRHTFVKSP